MKNLLKWGNPILLAALAGAAGARLFDFVDRGNWQIMDLVTMGYFFLFSVGLAIAMQSHLARMSR